MMSPIASSEFDFPSTRPRSAPQGHQIPRARRIVFTGGTHSGKSTIIRKMKSRGWETLDEAAPYVINRQVAELGKERFKDWMDANYSVFQDQIFARQTEMEQTCEPASKFLLMDRCGVDCIAYLRSRKLAPPNAMIAYARQSELFRVFLFDTLKSFAEVYTDSLAMRDLLFEVYRSYGYEPTLVPEMPISERCDFVLKEIERSAGEST